MLGFANLHLTMGISLALKVFQRIEQSYTLTLELIDQIKGALFKEYM